MASPKRERQRQNRAVKQKAETKVARKRKIFDTGRRVAIWVVVGVALFILANIVWG